MKAIPFFPYWLVLISGPPRSGKSRAGRCLAKELDADHFALSNMLKNMTHEHFGLGKELSPMAFEDCKDRPMQQFGGLTPREAYIMFSETIMKKNWGNDCLGRVGRERIAENQAGGTISIVSGVGFLEEIAPLIDEVGGAQTLHIEILPVQVVTQKDSRENLDLNHLGVTEIKIENRSCTSLLSSFWQHLPQYRKFDNDVDQEKNHVADKD